jgi:1A family penicillin-binding protein
VNRSRRLFLFVIALAFLILGEVVYGWLFTNLPDLNTLPEHLNLPSVRITDRNGKLLYDVLPSETGRHTVLPLNTIPLCIKQATIATEDQHFYENPGVDFRGIIRSFWINLQGGEALAGGSTITQQVARNLLLNPQERGERTLRRKLRESILAWQLTRRFSKDEILALYLNHTYYGGLSYGVEAAAQTYFGKSASQLDLAECALLAGLPQAPSLYNPFSDLEAARERQKIVLQLMQNSGYISEEERQLAERETLNLAAEPYPAKAMHFALMVKAEMDRLIDPQTIAASGGLTIRTTLNLDWQQEAEKAIARQLDSLAHSQDGINHNLNNMALAALDPQTGEVLALVGSRDYFDAQHSGAINMATSPRQPGSALKPLVYALAMDPQQPTPWTAATMIMDVSTSFLTHEGDNYTPTNYDGKEHGPVLVRQALASSLNIPAVIALKQVGLKSLFDFASTLGITTLTDPDHYDLSLALGGGEVKLIELTAAYAAFANTGYRVTPTTILNIQDIQGKDIYTQKTGVGKRVIDERVAWLITDILSDDSARILGFGANSILRLDRPAAVKTGTTTDFRDNWAVGYTPDLVVGVWAGNTDQDSMQEVTGLTGAAPVWHQFVRSVLSGTPVKDFTRPEGLVRREVCTLSGLLPTEACPERRSEWFISGTEPHQPDTFYRPVVLDKRTNRLADDSTPAEYRESRTALDLPAPAYHWARSRGLLLYNDLISGHNTTSAPAANQSGSSLQILTPAVNSVYRMVSDIPIESQQLRIEAGGEPGLSAVSLWLDGKRIVQFDAPPYTTWWQLAPGKHSLRAEATTRAGEQIASDIVFFEVIGLNEADQE